MRKLLFGALLTGVLCVVAGSTRGAPQWKEVPSGVQITLRGVSFGDRLHGWAVGDKGTILWLK